MTVCRDLQFADRVVEIARGSVRAGRLDRESRCFPRRPYHAWVAFRSRERGPIRLLRGFDLSVGGLGATSGTPLEVGDTGTLLMARSDGEPVVLAAVVAHCGRRGEMDYRCGLRFLRLAEAGRIDDFRDGAGRLPEVGIVRSG
jgi:hypothetical protein